MQLRIGLVRHVLSACQRVLGLHGLYVIGRLFGTIEYLTDYKRRRRVHAKLTEYFKEQATLVWRRDVARRYFMRVRCDKMFYTIMDRIPRDVLMTRLKLVGREYIDMALARGKGASVTLCHFGSHHVAGFFMALLGYSLAGVRDPKESHVRRYIQQRYRDTFPEVAAMKMFYSDAFPRELYRYYANNRIVASLLDVDRPRGQTMATLPVTIFGETREFLTGPLKIAMRCGAETLQGFVISRPDFVYEIVLTPPLFDADCVTNTDETIAEALQEYARRVEDHAREHPDHLMKI